MSNDLQSHLAGARSVFSELDCSHPIPTREGTGIKDREVQMIIAISMKEPELLLHHGSLRQTGLIRLSLIFPQDTTYGRAFLGEERLAVELGLEISH